MRLADYWGKKNWIGDKFCEITWEKLQILYKILKNSKGYTVENTWIENNNHKLTFYQTVE